MIRFKLLNPNDEDFYNYIVKHIVGIKNNSVFYQNNYQNF